MNLGAGQDSRTKDPSVTDNGDGERTPIKLHKDTMASGDEGQDGIVKGARSNISRQHPQTRPPPPQRVSLTPSSTIRPLTRTLIMYNLAGLSLISLSRLIFAKCFVPPKEEHCCLSR